MKKNISPYISIIAVLAIFASGCTKERALMPDPVSDIEGNSYKTVKIGSQVWMAENLKTSKFNDGTEIPLIKDSEAWQELNTPGFCIYDNDSGKYKELYGALYNGYSIATGRLCPSGWHVPSRDEFRKLREFTGDTVTGGGKLKEQGTDHWLTPNRGADNSSSFKALPSGIRYFEGSFMSVLCFTSFWSSTESVKDEAWYMSLYFGDAAVNLSSISKKQGFSVRCVKE
jgi:uncharacterized protein (TIGR02145 family)